MPRSPASWTPLWFLSSKTLPMTSRAIERRVGGHNRTVALATLDATAPLASRAKASLMNSPLPTPVPTVRISFRTDGPVPGMVTFDPAELAAGRSRARADAVDARAGDAILEARRDYVDQRHAVCAGTAGLRTVIV